MITITDYGFRGSIGFITTSDGNTTYLDWRMLQNILEAQEPVIGQEVEVLDGEILFNSLTGI